MNASKSNPQYSAFIYSGGYKYDVTPAIVSIDLSESKTTLAQSADLTLANALVGSSKSSKRISDIFGVRDRVYIFADDGEKNDEVFRGFIWTRGVDTSADGLKISFKCYDLLIYLQESEVSEFFYDTNLTHTLVKKLCDKWGVEVSYLYYPTISHPKMALRGYLSDIIISDLLETVKKQEGKDYTIRGEKDQLIIRGVGRNTTIYKIVAGKNVISTSTKTTMDGMITRVVIVGNAGNDELEPVEATENGDTEQYGTLQKIIRRDTETTLDAARAEAKNTIKKDGKPKITYIVKAPDIPWIRKGDKVYVDAGDIKKKYLIVDDIDRSISNNKKEMTLSLSDP